VHADRGNWTYVKRKDTSIKSIIDYVLISKSLKDKIKSIIIDEDGVLRAKGNKHSDHNTIYLTLDISQETEIKKIKKWKNADEKKSHSFNKSLLNIKLNWEQTTPSYNTYEKHVKDTLHQIIGKRTIKCGQKRQTYNPTIKALRLEIKQARKAFEKEKPDTITKK